MKSALILFSVFILHFLGSAQYYQRTGKSNGLLLKSSPKGFLKTTDKQKFAPISNFGIGYARMFRPGMFIQLSYEANQEKLGLRENIDFHVISSGFFLDKAIGKTSDFKYRRLCFYHAFGLLAGINYNYAIAQNDRFSNTRGELAANAGFSFHNHFNNTSKRRQSISFHWDLIFSHGLTSFTSDYRVNDLSRSSVQLQLRIMKHKVVNFLN